MRSAVVVTRSLLDIAIKLMNHFPLFALLLRIKDPRRLPGPCIRLYIWGRIDDRVKGTTYFRVVSDKGHPVLLLEVHRLADSRQNDHSSSLAQVQTVSLWTVFLQYGFSRGERSRQGVF
jgi:hypothetical protein